MSAGGNSKLDLAHLRQVGLTLDETKLLRLLMDCGGEYPLPSTPAGLACVQGAIDKNLVECRQRYGERPRVRLTDEGRAVCSQLDVMNGQPKIEVVSG